MSSTGSAQRTIWQAVPTAQSGSSADNVSRYFRVSNQSFIYAGDGEAEQVVFQPSEFSDRDILHLIQKTTEAPKVIPGLLNLLK